MPLKDKEARRTYEREYCRKHPEKSRARALKWNEEHPERHRKTSREWAKNHPEKHLKNVHDWQEKNREKTRKSSSNWAKNNPEKRKIATHNRRARLRNNGGRFTFEQWIETKTKYNYQCLGCGKTELELLSTGMCLAPDHVLPVSKGGANDISNIQPLCHGRGGCNNKKKDKHTDYRPSFRSNTEEHA